MVQAPPPASRTRLPALAQQATVLSGSTPKASQPASATGPSSTLPPVAKKLPGVQAAAARTDQLKLAPDRIGNYLLGDTLGRGSFAKVKMAIHLPSKMKVAIKIIDKKKLKDEYVRKHLRREADILRHLRHPHIIRLYEVIDTENLYCLVTDVATGGELLDYVIRNRPLHEKEARRFLRQILSAMEYLHDCGIIHRDLKLENLLLDGELKIKLIDFGLSAMYTPSTFLSTRCGSLEYTAPEILVGQKYGGPEADVWSIGVTLYAMLTGKLPFEGATVSILYSKIRNQMYALPANLSDSCQDLLRRLFCPDPQRRITIAGIIKHEWMQLGVTYERPITTPSSCRSDTGDCDVEKGLSVCEQWALEKLQTMGFARGTVLESVWGHKCDALAATFELLAQAHEVACRKGQK
eukprot:Opistho-1_new@25933